MLYAITRWVSRHRKVLMSLSAVCVAAVLVSFPLTSSSATPVPAGAPVPAAAVQHLTSAAAQVATIGGDAKPVWTEGMRTARDNALRVATPGDTVPGSASQVVYLVIMEGNFTLTDVPTLAKSQAPTGHYLTVTFDPATFQIIDLGLTNTSPVAAFRSLGLASTLKQ